MKQRNFLTAFAAVIISLLMLCGCSGDDIVKIEGTPTGTDISRYINSADEEISSDETALTEGAAETIFSEEMISADITETSEENSSETEQAVQKYYFRSDELFDSHYEKHGAEFGDITQEEYLDLANELINAAGDNILHKTEKEDGDFLYYDTETNEFLVLSTDGYIRTFFKPNAGLDYWERQ